MWQSSHETWIPALVSSGQNTIHTEIDSSNRLLICILCSFYTPESSAQNRTNKTHIKYKQISCPVMAQLPVLRGFRVGSVRMSGPRLLRTDHPAAPSASALQL